MAAAYTAIIFGIVLIAADLALMVYSYIIHFNGSSTGGKNTLAIIFAIVLVISSALALGGGIDLKGVLTSLNQPNLDPAQKQQLLRWAANLKIVLIITGAIQAVSAISLVLVLKKMRDEKKEELNNYKSTWDWDKIRS